MTSSRRARRRPDQDGESAGSLALPDWLDPLLTPAELRACDAFAITEPGGDGRVLMERAGTALAETAARALPAGRIAVLCGPGNNGGDGLVAARVLEGMGHDVLVLTTGSPAAYRGDAAWARDGYHSPTVIFAAPLLDGCTGAIDALLGTGATGAPRGVVLRSIQALDARQLPVVAADLPSGVDAATGAVAGTAVRAVQTVTFHAASPGHVVWPGKGHVGALEVVDIGIPFGAPITPQIGRLTDGVSCALHRRGGNSHKYAAGAVLVVAGGARYPGAGVLAVRGAQRGGAGYVTAFVSGAAAPLVLGRSPEAIVQEWPPALPQAEQALKHVLESRADAVVAGPGLGDDLHGEPLVRAVLASERPVVLDADGLAPYAGDPEALRRRAPLIITPHAGELGRLLGRSSAEIGDARLEAAREAARRAQAIVVLKGDDTLIAAPDGRVAVNDLSAHALATAGTGDVLAGLAGALLAAGNDPWLTACGAVRIHAQAGRIAAARAGSIEGVVAFDVAEALPSARGAADTIR